MQKEPTYLTDHHIRIFNQQGMELQPEQVNWYTDEAVNYMFRQDPGDQNSLGFVKLQFHNPHDVYLHDTPAKNLFGSDYRFEFVGLRARVQRARAGGLGAPRHWLQSRPRRRDDPLRRAARRCRS